MNKSKPLEHFSLKAEDWSRKAMALLHLFILLSAVSSLSGSYGQFSKPTWPYCSNTDNYTMASRYQVNLAQLMADLPPNAINNGGFANRTAGEAPDKVFGLIMCHADRNWTECQNCIRASAAGIQQTCPFSRVARSVYGACVLQYSNESFFSVAIDWSGFDVQGPTGVVDTASMNVARSKLMSRLTVEAAGSFLRLGNGSDRYTDSQGMEHEMYGMAQCTRDLKASECTRCLIYFVEQLWVLMPTRISGSIKGYSCYMRYKLDGPIVPINIFPVAEPPQRPPSSGAPLPFPPGN